MQIPKLIHFIWAGGEKIMPDNALLNVANWAKENPDFNVIIWVDSVTDPNVNEKYNKKFTNLFSDQALTNIQIKDIHEYGFDLPEVRYELDSLWPNYGASSDLLRYAILHKLGGAYFDCGDVYPNPLNPLAKIRFPETDKDSDKTVFDEELSGPKLLIHVTPHSAVRGAKEAPGTEAIICTPGHPKMQALLDTAQQSYHGMSWNHKLLQYEYVPRLKPAFTSTPTPGSPRAKLPSVPQKTHHSTLFNKKKNLSLKASMKTDQHEVEKRRAIDTLELTGPGMAISCLSGSSRTVPEEYLMPHDAEHHIDWVTLPKKHALSWVPMRIVRHDYEQAIQSALGSIRFEADNMNMLNLNKHVEEIAVSVLGDTLEGRKELKNSIKRDLIFHLSRDERFEQKGSDLLVMRRNSLSKGM